MQGFSTDMTRFNVLAGQPAANSPDKGDHIANKPDAAGGAQGSLSVGKKVTEKESNELRDALCGSPDAYATLKSEQGLLIGENTFHLGQLASSLTYEQLVTHQAKWCLLQDSVETKKFRLVAEGVIRNLKDNQASAFTDDHVYVGQEALGLVLNPTVADVDHTQFNQQQISEDRAHVLRRASLPPILTSA